MIGRQLFATVTCVMYRWYMRGADIRTGYGDYYAREEEVCEVRVALLASFVVTGQRARKQFNRVITLSPS